MRVKFENGSTFLHRLNPLTKLLVLVAYSVSIFTFDSLEAEILFFIAMLFVIIWLRSRALFSLVTSKYFMTFAVLLVAVQVMFTKGGELLFSIPLIFFKIDVTTMGILMGLIIAFRFLTIIMGSAIFIFTTDPNELAYALMRAGLPYRFGFMLVTAIRFIPVFESEASTVRNAQAARGLDIDRGGTRGLIKTVRYTLMPLIVSALSKVDVLVISMEGRGFGYRRTRTFTRSSSFRTADVLISAIVVILLIVLLMNLWLGFFKLPRLITFDCIIFMMKEQYVTIPIA
jgi:energy-coupling factor transport system permease protein